jgi:hypothetical protein
MSQELLEKEVSEYNEIVKKQQTVNQTLAELEQQRLVKLGRVQAIQEALQAAKSATEAAVTPEEPKTES